MSSGAINSKNLNGANNIGLKKPFVSDADNSKEANGSAGRARDLAASLRDDRSVSNKADLISGKTEKGIQDHEVWAEIEDFIKTAKGGGEA